MQNERSTRAIGRCEEAAIPAHRHLLHIVFGLYHEALGQIQILRGSVDELLPYGSRDPSSCGLVAEGLMIVMTGIYHCY